MPLSDIVNVQITRETQSVSQAGFGTLMILGQNKRWNDLIRFYSNMQAVAEDFSPFDPEYVASQAVFSQAITPDLIAIGRRQADSITVQILSAMTGKSYTVKVNGVPYTYLNSASSDLQSTVTFNGDFGTGNLINIAVNSVTVGTVTSIVNFDIDFDTSNSIVATINGAPITAVPFATNQATTIANLASALQATAAIATATVTGARQITATFAAQGNNTINSIVTTGGATQPVATIAEGGLAFNTNQLMTMQGIQSALEGLSTVQSVSIQPNGPFADRVLKITTNDGMSSVVTLAQVTQGTSPPSATIVTTSKPSTNASVAEGLTNTINATATNVTATDNNDGTLTIEAVTPGTPYTISTSTDIVNPNAARVTIEDAQPNSLYSLRVNGLLVQYTTTPSTANNEAIASAMVAIINANSTSVGANDNGNGSFNITSNDQDQTFVLTIVSGDISQQSGMITIPILPSGSVATDLDLIQAVSSAWYALALLDRTVATVLAAATWVESRVKIFGTASDNLDIINVPVGTDTTSIAAQLNNLGYVRSFVLYHQDSADSYPECAWFGTCLPFVPGSETWAFKRLNGIAYSNLSNNQSLNARNKSCNTYEYIGGVGITQFGTMAQGEYIDIIRGVDWLQATIQTYVFSVLVNSPKVPYTNAGITSIEAQIRKALEEGIANNFLSDDPAPIVMVPKAANVSSADKAARILRNVTFQATLAGAIHIVQIRGTVTV